MKRVFNTSGVKSRGYKDTDIIFSLSTTPTTRVTSGSSVSSTLFDENVESYTSAGTVTEGIISVSALLGVGIDWTNVTPSIATFDPVTRQLTRVSSGTALVNAKVQGRIKQVATPISSTGSTSTAIFTGFVSGSLAKHCYDWFISAVAGKTASDTTQNFLSGSARSGTIWANAVDLSCIITGAANGWQQGALIAPRFAVVASHVGVDTSYTCRDNSGNAVTRTVTGSTSLGGDLTLVCFASNFTGITPAKILPSSFGNKYKPNQTLRQGVPVMKWKRMGAAWKVGIGVGDSSTGLSFTRPTELVSWYMEWEGGDSGSPYGTVINGNFVFLGNAWTGPGTNDDGGSFLASNISGLTAAMDALVASTSSTLSYADLSGFNTY